jgi:hypothetical protein
MRLRAVLLTAAALFCATEARAQLDAPSFMAPRTGDDIGVYVTAPGDADYGVQGIWRQRGGLNVGLRFGYTDIGDESLVSVGAETWALVKGATDDFPVDVSITFGAGATFNGGTTGEVPVGLSIGRSMSLGPIQLQVYGHPRGALLFHVDVPEDQDELEFDARIDAGVDLVLANTLKLRFGATLGDFDALGVGVAYRWRRAAEEH